MYPRRSAPHSCCFRSKQSRHADQTTRSTVSVPSMPRRTISTGFSPTRRTGVSRSAPGM